jgi:hypothetical protein
LERGWKHNDPERGTFVEAAPARVAVFVEIRRKGHVMKLYSSFLVRCWVIQEEREKIVFDIEHIQNGEHQRAASPEEALEWMLTACRTNQPTELEEDIIVPDYA